MQVEKRVVGSDSNDYQQLHEVTITKTEKRTDSFTGSGELPNVTTPPPYKNENNTFSGYTIVSGQPSTKLQKDPQFQEIECVKKQSSYRCCSPQLNCVIVAIVLAVLAGVASYYCFTQGFTRMDYAVTSLQRFVGGSLLYMGVVFAIVSVGNVAITGAVALFGKKDLPYSPNTAKVHIAVSVFGPILLLPAALIFGMKKV